MNCSRADAVTIRAGILVVWEGEDVIYFEPDGRSLEKCQPKNRSVCRWLRWWWRGIPLFDDLRSEV
jgi:hypothetical protein